ncbi:MAG TPA: vanadium-dependent haloperoxidase [Gemmatimonadales bacterium]|nr:vanadium-dependent haloperoxidase [Gemmatimonadales bacterium]
MSKLELRAVRLRTALAALVAFGTIATPPMGYADEVLDWNRIACRAVTTAPATPPPLAARILAMVHAAMFDAHNGIERRFEAIHVGADDAEPEPGASRRVAVVHAAFAVLLAEYPAQAEALTVDWIKSLAAITGRGQEENQSIQRGMAWGQYVADQIRAWRAVDGVFPLVSYPGSLATGEWRPTPPAFAPGFGITLGQAVPFIIPTTSTFRPAGPPPLHSVEYANDVNEVKRVGEAVTTERTADQTQSARFWAGTAPTFWNRTAVAAAEQCETSLSENARLFALMNMAIADTVFTTWESKYHYLLWRPIHAITLASTDDNDLTIEQPGWTPFLATPAYPEYTSGHQSISGAAATVLTAYFGNGIPVTGTSEGLPGITRSWPNFESAADEAFMARIWAGIHFRFAMRDTRQCARQIAAYVLQNAAQPLKGQHMGQVGE